MRKIGYTLLLILNLISAVWADDSRYTQQSVLNTGKWVKIQVADNGIYKLTQSDIQSMGFSNIANIAVYGYGGWPLDEDFSTDYIDDLPEIVKESRS